MLLKVEQPELLAKSGAFGLPEEPQPQLDEDGEVDLVVKCANNPEVTKASVWAPGYIAWCDCEADAIVLGNKLSALSTLLEAWHDCDGMIT